MMERRTPPAGMSDFLGRVADLCSLHGGSVVSWCRTENRNHDVGGSLSSKHLARYGYMACDVVLDEQGNSVFCQAFVENAKILGLWVKDEGDHIHLQGVEPGA